MKSFANFIMQFSFWFFYTIIGILLRCTLEHNADNVHTAGFWSNLGLRQFMQKQSKIKFLFLFWLVMISVNYLGGLNTRVAFMLMRFCMNQLGDLSELRTVSSRCTGNDLFQWYTGKGFILGKGGSIWCFWSWKAMFTGLQFGWWLCNKEMSPR
jgi:hypothetical protein